jgi:alpha-glucosidase (family GH31 glycosyl hydrolase)
VFVELGEYRMKLMKETEMTGVPITRSLMLEFDNTEWNIDDQFMLGSEVMMAPILTRDATKRKVFFPYIGKGGYWIHYFTGRKIPVPNRSGIYKWISCPLGTPAAFKRVSGKEYTAEYAT